MKPIEKDAQVESLHNISYSVSVFSPTVSAETKTAQIVPCALTEELRLTGWADRVRARCLRQKADGDLIVDRLLGAGGGRVQ